MGTQGKIPTEETVGSKAPEGAGNWERRVHPRRVWAGAPRELAAGAEPTFSHHSSQIMRLLPKACPRLGRDLNTLFPELMPPPFPAARDANHRKPNSKAVSRAFSPAAAQDAACPSLAAPPLDLPNSGLGVARPTCL